MTKKNVLLTSLAGIVFLLTWDKVGNYFWCDLLIKNGSQGNCPFVLASLESYFIPIFPLFFFSLVTYWMRDEVYRAWFKFAKWWIPGSMLLILLTPSDTGGGGFGPQLSFGKPDVALLASLLFFIISTVLVTRAFFKSRNK